MNVPTDVVEGQRLDEADVKLKTFFAELEVKQVEVLDASGKSLIERIAALLAVLFAVTAFGNNFPPPYLKGNGLAKGMVVATLALYMTALFMAMLVIRPRFYKLYRYNLTQMKEEVEKMVEFKSRWLYRSGICFWLGSIFLSALIVLIIYGFS